MFQCPTPIINLPVSPPNHEWLKILTSAAVGLVAGLILEPLKGLILHERDLTLMLEGVLGDCRAVEIQISDDSVDEVLAGKRKVNAAMPAFEYYWEKKRELFFETIELRILASLCQQIMLIEQSASCRPVREVVIDLRNAIREIKTLFLEPSVLHRIRRTFSRRGRHMRGIRTSAWLKGKPSPPSSGSRDGQ
jgi:hypothetical protein